MYDEGKSLMKVHVEYGDLKEDFEGDPDDVVRAFLTSLSKVYPSLEVVKKLVFQPNLSKLTDDLAGLVKFAPEGLLVMTSDVPSEEAMIISLAGSYLGHRLGQLDSDATSANNLAKTTGKALKTISNQLAWMIDDGIIERVGRGQYRITSLGLIRCEQIVEKMRTRGEA